MSKHSKDPLRALEEYDPAVRHLGMERVTSGKQIFDYRTHKLRPQFRDEIQGRGTLMWAKHYAQRHGIPLRLYALEKRLLAKVFKDGIVILIAACLAMCAQHLDPLDYDDGITRLIEFVDQDMSLKTVK